MTNIPKDQKFIGECSKKLNQVVGLERADTSTVIGCTSIAGESMHLLKIHRAVRVPTSWTQDAAQYFRVRVTQKDT